MPRGLERRRPLAAAAACCTMLLALSLAACGDTTRDGDGTGGAGVTTSGAGGEGPQGSGKGSGGAPSTSTQSGAGAEQTCDDLGFCGEADDPGCVACSISEGPCIEQYQACVGDCQALRACYAACDEDDESCFTECNTEHPDGIPGLNTLFECILCQGCPVSCNFDTATCP